MLRFSFLESKFGNFKTILLKDNESGASAEIALKGATLLNYYIKLNNDLFNVVDGFKTAEELVKAKGARCYIMAPFANRIPNGEYSFDAKKYKINPQPPRTEVIHGFIHASIFRLVNYDESPDSVSAILSTEISEDQYPGYPFKIRVNVEFRLSSDRLNIKIEAANVGETKAPFFCGWHPYFKASDDGIEDLILTINAASTIKMDNAYIPLPGLNAYEPIDNNPNMDFNSTIEESKRVISGRKLDLCYSELKADSDGYAYSSIYNPQNKLKVTMFQKGGVCLAFSGDSLAVRKRKSVALEPMMAITNSFNRSDSKSIITLAPNKKTVFEFGVMAECLK